MLLLFQQTNPVGYYNLLKMSDIKVTKEDCAYFTFGMLHTLKANGFNVRSVQEAFICINSILKVQVTQEINRSMEELQCPNCHHISGSKGIGQIN